MARDGTKEERGFVVQGRSSVVDVNEYELRSCRGYLKSGWKHLENGEATVARHYADTLLLGWKDLPSTPGRAEVINDAIRLKLAAELHPSWQARYQSRYIPVQHPRERVNRPSMIRMENGPCTADDGPCPRCDFPGREPLPTWAKPGNCFALDGRSFRIVGLGSSNKRFHDWRCHFEEVVSVESLDEHGDHELPPIGTPITDVARFFERQRHLERFTADELRKAIRVVSPD